MNTFSATLFRSLPCLLFLLSGALFAAGTTSEIAIQNTAIEKMLMEELFIDRGRYNPPRGNTLPVRVPRLPFSRDV